MCVFCGDGIGIAVESLTWGEKSDVELMKENEAGATFQHFTSDTRVNPNDFQLLQCEELRITSEQCKPSSFYPRQNRKQAACGLQSCRKLCGG